MSHMDKNFKIHEPHVKMFGIPAVMLKKNSGIPGEKKFQKTMEFQLPLYREGSVIFWNCPIPMTIADSLLRENLTLRWNCPHNEIEPVFSKHVLHLNE